MEKDKAKQSAEFYLSHWGLCHWLSCLARNLVVTLSLEHMSVLHSAWLLPDIQAEEPIQPLAPGRWRPGLSCPEVPLAQPWALPWASVQSWARCWVS